MALVPTSNNQIIAVPIKSLTTNTANKIQFTTTSTTASIIATTSNNNSNAIAATSTITLPPTIKSITGLKTLPSSLKIANTIPLTKSSDQNASNTEIKPTATYLICSKSNLLDDLNKAADIPSLTSIKEDNHPKFNSSLDLSTPILTQINSSTISQPITQIIHQPVNQIIISQPATIIQSSNHHIISSQPINFQISQPIKLKTNQQSTNLQTINQQSINQKINSQTINPQIINKQKINKPHQQLNMDVEIQNNIKSMSQPINEEKESNLNKKKNHEKIEITFSKKEDGLVSSNNSPQSNQLKEDLKNKDYIDEIEILSEPDSDFDVISCLTWNNNVGILPGTNLQFKLNEYDCLELLTDKEADEIRRNFNRHFSDDKLNKIYQTDYLSNGNSKGTANNDDPYSVCSACGIKKLKSLFIRKGRFCSQNCATYQSSQLRNLKKSNILDTQLQDRFNLNSKLSNFNNYSKQLRSRKSSLDNFDQDNFYYSNGCDEIENVKTKVKENHKQVKYFVWKSYLIETRSIAAPLKCFKPNQIYNDKPNLFKPGMKIEAIDPLHPSLFCVATVVEVCGFRVRVHLDKYSSIFDFWVNCDSPFIFPIEFCSKTNRKLQPPKNYSQFEWTSYLQQEKAKAAPKHCFYYWCNRQPDQLPFGFKTKMKLEAVDKANSNLVCVASINDILGDWLLIHFDGWDDSYDYWTEYTSPYIHPTNWCKSKGKSLTPPKDYPKNNDKFNWQDYLEETKSMSVPSSAIKVRPVNQFKTSMKLEVVDRRNPRYIRVATIVSRTAWQVKINFDNWDDKYDFWIDDDSPDLHPVNWCYKTNNCIEEPPSYDYDASSYYNRCPIFNCKGIGSIRNPNLTEHMTIEDCPYSEDNMDYEVPERFGESSELSSSDNFFENEYESNVISSILPSPVNSGDSISLSTGNKFNYSSLKIPSAGTKNMYNSHTLECFEMYNSDLERLSRSSSPNSDLNMLPIRQSMLDLKTSFLQLEEPLLHWDKNTKHLISYVNTLKTEDVLEWDCNSVAEFVSSLPGCQEYSNLFKEQNIDGQAFLLLTQNDLIKILGIKLGPGIKLYNSILILRKNLSSS